MVNGFSLIKRINDKELMIKYRKQIFLGFNNISDGLMGQQARDANWIENKKERGRINQEDTLLQSAKHI